MSPIISALFISLALIKPEGMQDSSSSISSLTYWLVASFSMFISSTSAVTCIAWYSATEYGCGKTRTIQRWAKTSQNGIFFLTLLLCNSVTVVTVLTTVRPVKTVTLATTVTIVTKVILETLIKEFTVVTVLICDRNKCITLCSGVHV